MLQFLLIPKYVSNCINTKVKKDFMYHWQTPPLFGKWLKTKHVTGVWEVKSGFTERVALGGGP